MISYLTNMARYNQWVNRRLFDKAQLLPAAEIAKDRGAFFGSILGTLNHILVGDMFWLRRFSSSKLCQDALAPIREMPMPTSLRDVLFDDVEILRSKREAMDALILDFSHTWNGAMLASPIRYRNMAGEKHQQALGALLQHLFNHQTHHRGQTLDISMRGKPVARLTRIESHAKPEQDDLFGIWSDIDDMDVSAHVRDMRQGRRF